MDVDEWSVLVFSSSRGVGLLTNRYEMNDADDVSDGYAG